MWVPIGDLKQPWSKFSRTHFPSVQDLVIRFLRRAASNLQQDMQVDFPSRQLPLQDRRRILSHQLGEFIHRYDQVSAFPGKTAVLRGAAKVGNMNADSFFSVPFRRLKIWWKSRWATEDIASTPACFRSTSLQRGSRALQAVLLSAEWSMLPIF